MEILTKYKEVKNEEKNGIELYFEEIPTSKECEELKSNGYRWHSVKKCWYKKEGITQKTKTREEANYLGIKIGDIFEMSWGYEQTNVNFFRVKELRGKTQIIIQEVNLTIKEEHGIGGMSADRSYNLTDYKLVKNSCFVKDNEKGTIKKVLGTKERPYLDMTSYANAYKYEGEKLYESWYY